MTNLVIRSHERSGTHLLMSLMLINFDIRSHLDHFPYSPDKKPENSIYIYRDGRDVLVSWWRLLQSRHYDFFSDFAILLNCCSFSDFLRGAVFALMVKRNPNWLTNPVDETEYYLLYIVRNMLRDPIKYWKLHVEQFLESDIYAVCYEYLLYSSQRTKILLEIKERFALKPADGFPRMIQERVGPNPGAGTVGLWKKYFTVADAALFEGQTRELLHRLNYELILSR